MQCRTQVVDFKVSVLFNILIIFQFPQQLYGTPCSVEWDYSGGISDCNDKNLTEIPSDLSKDTVHLIMDNNNIRVLDLELLSRLPNLRSLSLRNNQISKVKASEFKQLTTLEILDLHDNCLRTLENAPFSALPGLIYLDLSKNSLTGVDGIFTNLSKLAKLYLSDNLLTSLSNDAFLDTVNLTMLTIQDNLLKKIDLGVFGHLERLSTLMLTRNDIHEITGSWQKGSDLEMLDLSQCQLTDIPSNLPSSVQFLNVGSNRLTSITKASLENYGQLEILVIDHNQISSIENRSFLKLEKLRDLDLSDNSLAVFPGYLPKSLRDINLDRNKISSFHPSSRLTYLISLSLKSNKIAEFNRKFFSGLKDLSFLYMDGNPLKVLADNDLAEQRKLEVLSLNSCPLERIDIRPFIRLKSLKELHLAFINNSRLSFTGAILEALPRLEKLNIQGSPTLVKHVAISPSGLASLKDKLNVLNIMNCRLTHLQPLFKVYLGNVRRIKLAGNPFNCDADLRWLYDWMKDEPDRFPYKDSIVCATPGRIRGTPIHYLTESYFLSMSDSSSTPSPQELFPYSEVSEEIIQDLDYPDDLSIYPVSGPQEDRNCRDDTVEESSRTSTNTEMEISKYASSVNTMVTDGSSPEERTTSEKTSTLCAGCDFDMNTTDNPLGELPQKSSTTEINHRTRGEIREDNLNSRNSDNVASITTNNNGLSLEATSSTTVSPIEDNSPSFVDIDPDSGDIPNVVKTKREPPRYLKIAAVIASSGAGLLALSTGSLLFFILRRFRKKKNEQQVPPQYPMENC